MRLLATAKLSGLEDRDERSDRGKVFVVEVPSLTTKYLMLLSAPSFLPSFFPSAAGGLGMDGCMVSISPSGRVRCRFTSTRGHHKDY